MALDDHRPRRHVSRLHWFELALDDGRVAVLYFDRKSRRDQPRWWLYTLSDGS